MIDLCDALRELLEPASQDRTVSVDDSCSQPNEWSPNTLYVFPVAHRYVRIGTGGVGVIGEVREDFTIRAVYAHSNPQEEPTGVRDREVTAALEARFEDYVLKILTNEAGQLWDNLTPTVDHDFLRQFEVRGVSIVAEGYRIRSS